MTPSTPRPRIAIIGPVYPYRAGIAHCTVRLAEELGRDFDVEIVSFARQYPRHFYPGGSDLDPTLESRRPPNARFTLDILNPLSWIAEGRRLRKENLHAVVFVWWIWVWAIPYRTLRAFLPKKTKIVFQCHNISDKEPAGWKTALTNRALGTADSIVVHARTEAEEVVRRLGESVRRRVTNLFLPLHEVGGEIPSRTEARRTLGITHEHVALCFGHVRPFKGLDIAFRAWEGMKAHVLLLVAGEVWWDERAKYERMLGELGLSVRVRCDFRFIPDAEVATYFAATDVVLTPYRHEAQSGVAMTAFHFLRPVIATAVGGLPELIRDGQNGLLIPPEDPDALREAVEQFFSRGDRGEWEARIAAEADRYSWKRYADAIGVLLGVGLSPRRGAGD